MPLVDSLSSQRARLWFMSICDNYLVFSCHSLSGAKHFPSKLARAHNLQPVPLPPCILNNKFCVDYVCAGYKFSSIFNNGGESCKITIPSHAYFETVDHKCNNTYSILVCLVHNYTNCPDDVDVDDDAVADAKPTAPLQYPSSVSIKNLMCNRLAYEAILKLNLPWLKMTFPSKIIGSWQGYFFAVLMWPIIPGVNCLPFMYRHGDPIHVKFNHNIWITWTFIKMPRIQFPLRQRAEPNILKYFSSLFTSYPEPFRLR